jgi:hypothetical protein
MSWRWAQIALKVLQGVKTTANAGRTTGQLVGLAARAEEGQITDDAADAVRLAVESVSLL